MAVKVKTTNTKIAKGPGVARSGDEPSIVAKTLNFDDEVKGFGTLPADRYLLDVVKAKATKSSKKGTPEIAIEFAVAEGQYTKRRVFEHFYWTDKSYPFLKRFLTAAGIEVHGNQQLQDVADLIVPGTQVYAILTVDTNRDDNEIKKYQPVA